MVQFRQLPWTKLLRFLITGGSALAIDFAIYYVLTRYIRWPYLVSRSFSLGLAMIWSFSVNRQWTFQATKGQVNRQVARYLVVMVLTSLLSLSLMRLGVEVLRWHDLVVIILVAGIVTAVNYLAHQRWTYAD